MKYPKREQDYFKWIRDNLKIDLSIDKNTKIVSLGSCFAREIKDWLLNNDFNYLLTEQTKNPWISQKLYPGDKGRLPSSHASAAWDRVYNTATFRQIIEYSFISEAAIDDEIRDRLYEARGHVFDLKRTRTVYSSYDVASKDIREHISESRGILEQAELLIFTMGLTEVWHSDVRKMTLASHPGRVRPPADFSFTTTTYRENYNNTKEAIRILREQNPGLQILLTVSPVHLNKTFREDVDSVSASCASKSTLRAVANEICIEDPSVHYFPSYEIVNILSPLSGVQAYADGQHVSRDIVDTIMKTFSERVVK